MIIREWTAVEGRSQIHFYGGGLERNADHWENLTFSEINKFSHGHHGRSGGGNDTYNLRNLSSVRDTIVGRLEDFDPSRDQIRIEGKLIDLQRLPENVRLVEFNGTYNNPGADPQMWLLIKTSGGGTVFYALEGARVDLPGVHRVGSDLHGLTERHFLLKEDLPDFAMLNDWRSEMPQNFVPVGYTAEGGIVIHDTDEDHHDLMETIVGTSRGDLIAAGLNDDKVHAGRGSDKVWGGSGSDIINGGAGADHIWGGTGNDTIYGSWGHDTILGQSGNDRISAGKGNDIVAAGNGNDRVLGGGGNDRIWGGVGNDKLFGGAGDDRIWGGSGNDIIEGGGGADYVTGEGGADHFVFKKNDLVQWIDLNGAEHKRLGQIDVIGDFEVGVDKIHFIGFLGVERLYDVKAWRVDLGENKLFSLSIGDQDFRLFVDVPDDLSWSEFIDTGNFSFE